jgi:hypothetical protein
LRSHVRTEVEVPQAEAVLLALFHDEVVSLEGSEMFVHRTLREVRRVGQFGHTCAAVLLQRRNDGERRIDTLYRRVLRLRFSTAGFPAIHRFFLSMARCKAVS